MNTQREKAIILLSGGLDSTTTLYLAQARYDISLALSFDYGQRAAKKEMNAASFFAQKFKLTHQIISLDWLASISSSLLNQKNSSNLPRLSITELDDLELTQKSAQAVWVPNRNGLFLNIAACFAEVQKASVILTGFNREEAQTFPDNTTEFTHAISQSLFYSTLNQVKVVSLVQDFSKRDIATEALRLNIPLDQVWSCYQGQAQPCNTCESCLRFNRAFSGSTQ